MNIHRLVPRVEMWGESLSSLSLLSLPSFPAFGAGFVAVTSGRIAVIGLQIAVTAWLLRTRILGLSEGVWLRV